MTPPSRAAARSAAYARAVLERVQGLSIPDGACEDVADLADDIRETLEVHDELAADRLSWESYDSDLRRMPEPHPAAVDASARDAEELAWMLTEVIEKHMGRAMAEYVSGEEAKAA